MARERLRKFRAAFSGAERPAIELYSLDVALAAGLQTLLAVTEVVMREAMNKQLTQMLGPRWFDQQGWFDYRTKGDILRAKTYLGGPRAASHAPPGKVVAALSFGAWVGLLARGSAPVKNSGLPPIDYTATLWDPCLAAAFPQWASDRAQLEALAGRVRSVRNRVAHHEPIVFGVPVHGVLPGNRQVRLRPATAIAAVLSLLASVCEVTAAELRSVTGIWTLLQHPHLAVAEGVLQASSIFE